MALEWSEYVGDELPHEVLTYRAAPIQAGPVKVEICLYDDKYDEFGKFMRLRASVNGIELALVQVDKLGIFGAPDDEGNAEYLQYMVDEVLEQLVFEAHANLGPLLEKAEAHVKALREARYSMGRVMLASGAHSLTLTQEMARRVLMQGQQGVLSKRMVQPPFRMKRIAENLVRCYDELNRVTGHILFDPQGDSLGPSTNYGLRLVEAQEGI